MKTFLKRLLLFSIPPIIILIIVLGTFFIFDPFKILKKYDEFYSSIIEYNEDYVATERYLKNKNSYNSYILGSSRAGCGFQTRSWLKYLKKDDRAYSYTASNESIFGMRGKLRLIDNEECKIENVLLIIDLDITLKKLVNSHGHLYIKHPLISGESTKNFIAEYIKDYIFTGFFIAYLDYKLFKSKREYMNRFFYFNINENEKYISFNTEHKEKLIKTDEFRYYEEKKNIFYERDSIKIFSEKQFFSQAVEYFNEINGIFKKHKTKYKIIISPLYDQKEINNADLTILCEIFGKENVYNFSGINFITNQKHNYYEKSHYRIQVGNEILRNIYQN
jgi:hypothetical protein